MDQRQRDLIESVARELAERIPFERVAGALQKKGVVSKEKIEEILIKVKLEFSRNIQLLYALQESESSTAFDDFVQILVDDKNKEALKLVRPSGIEQIWKKMSDRFMKSPTKLPLGMDSGTPSTSGLQNYSGSGEIASSPLKERHRATLIRRSSGEVINIQASSCDSGFLLNISGGSSGSTVNQSQAHLHHHQLNLKSGAGGVCASIPHDIGGDDFNKEQRNSNFKLRPIRRLSATSNTSSSLNQQPTRPQELTLINNLTINDNREVESPEEPVVCWHPYARPQDAQRVPSPHYCHPSYGSSSSDSDSSNDSLVVDPNLILDPNVTMAIARDGPNMMRVKKATTCHNNCEEDYKMTARPRGPCLIVNNIDFEAEMLPTRKGSDEDARRFDDIFKQLGFTVILRRNQTADQMRALFKEVAAECKPEHDSVFVFILSHGSEHGIYGTDGMEVYLESEIISCFDNRNCKAMLGKPKVFVIQACRGRSKDCGGDGDTTDSVAWPSVAASPSDIKTPSQENRVPDSWLQRQPADGKKRKHPIRTDMLLVFSCLAGFVSVRNETAGSWLGVALAYFIMTHAHERDFQRILNLVNRDVIQRESSNGHIQSIETKLLGWTKNLYFNPGIYI